MRLMMYQLTKHNFKEQLKSSGFIDSKKSSYDENKIVYSKGYANTDYFAKKRLIILALKFFRKYVNDEIIFEIDAEFEESIYILKANRKYISELVGFDTKLFRTSQKKWTAFMENNEIRAKDIEIMANKLITNEYLIIRKKDAITSNISS